jgi:hypothetical protein
MKLLEIANRKFHVLLQLKRGINGMRLASPTNQRSAARRGNIQIEPEENVTEPYG